MSHAPSPQTPRAPASRRPGLGAVVALVAFLLCAPLWLNPGYFSHDELQWGAYADVPRWRDLPWVAWTDTGQLQWRPLTFNLWLAVSQPLFGSPRLLHALWVALGAAIAGALARGLAAMGVAPRVAAAAGVVFALNPYATYVHGWVATLADLLWVGLGLALARLLWTRRGRGGAGVAAASFALVALALAAKESALALPALLALGACLWPREPVLRAGAVGAALAAALYLGLRLEVLLHPPAGSGYALAPAAVPGNVLAYFAFVPRVSSLEVIGVLRAGPGIWIAAGLLWLLPLACLARRRPRLGLLLALGAPLALGPALVLPSTAGQYAYGFSLWAVTLLALGWPALGRAARAAAVALALVSSWHGVNVMRQMHAIGVRQAVFHPALADALARRPEGVALWSTSPRAFAFRRLTHQVPAWRGAPIGDRVRWVDAASLADYEVADDGRLRPLR